MQLHVVVDNMTVKQGLLAEWGYSVWIAASDRNILLDTGGIAHVLMHNLNFLNLNPKNVTDLVLSHGHFDHTAGVMDVLRVRPDCRVWAAHSLARPRWGDADASRLAGGGPTLAGLDYSAVDPYREIAPGVTVFTVPQEKRNGRWISCRKMFESTECGEKTPDTFADDVSILLETEKGASLVLGCAHAGLPNIMHYAQETFGIQRFDTVLGGTHLCSVSATDQSEWMQELASFEVKHWRPCHCTGFKAAAMLARHFEDVDWAAAGTVHEV